MAASSSYQFFPSGHVVYLDPASHKGLHASAAAFIDANYRQVARGGRLSRRIGRVADPVSCLPHVSG